MKEADVQRWIQDKLKKHFENCIYIFKVPQGQYTSRRGIPDLCIAINGRAYYIEVKMPNGKLTKLQQHEIQKINASGATALTIYGKDQLVLDAFIRRVEDERANIQKSEVQD